MGRTGRAEIILEFSRNQENMEGTPGFVSIMHTRSSNLSYYPHIHALSDSSGLDADRNCQQKRRGSSCPVKRCPGFLKESSCRDWSSCMLSENSVTRVKQKNIAASMNTRSCWTSAIKELGHRYPGIICGSRKVINYLGRYTHRMTISSSCILHMDEKTVTLRLKDYKSSGEWNELTLGGNEFIHRFLMHIPLKGFVRMPSYSTYLRFFP